MFGACLDWGLFLGTCMDTWIHTRSREPFEDEAGPEVMAGGLEWMSESSKTVIPGFIREVRKSLPRADLIDEHHSIPNRRMAPNANLQNGAQKKVQNERKNPQPGAK